MLNKLDHFFPFERFDSFFSIIYMTIDVKDGWFDYSCAGHPSPVLIRSDGTMDLLDQRGPIIGFGAEKPFGQTSIQLQAGDRVVLYTDGLLESRNAAGDYFGKPGLYDVLKNHRNEPILAMVDAVYAKIKDFRQQAAPDDDISLLAVEYNGSKQLNYTI
ncbi:Serine phosphatase RsbU, regulator of sigma subunit [Olavius sp. associated proteobacterium Delta 1]|nr:Serine phosphatase RsbU, regulator of sigma subunit [Olavius sp. associated proteobacterium Delta 1]